jgi:hypothetical protein
MAIAGHSRNFKSGGFGFLVSEIFMLPFQQHSSSVQNRNYTFTLCAEDRHIADANLGDICVGRKRWRWNF